MKKFLLAAALALWMGVVHAQTLSFWTMQLSPHLDDYVKGLITRYEAEHPGVRIRWVDLPWSEMERKVLTAIASGQPPDVVNLNPQFSAKLAEFRALAEPERHLPAEVLASYLPATRAGNRLDGRSFALPWYVTTNLTLYHKGLLGRAGISEVPTTHEELLQAAPKLSALGVHAYFTALDGSHPLETVVALGARLFSDRGCMGFDNAAGLAAFHFYREMYQRRWVPRNVITEGHRKAVELFVSGQVAMVSTGMQFLRFIRNSNPSLYAQIDIAPPLGGPNVAPNLAVMNLAVPQSSSHRDAAFKFAAYVTNAENQLAFAKIVPILPSTRASFDDPFLSTEAQSDDLLARARAMSVASALRGEVLVPPARSYSKLRNSFALQLQSQMLGRTSPDAALSAVASQWNALLGCKP